MTDRDRYFLGLPAWAFPGWKDRYFDDKPSRLSSYASVFNAVEGNTSFYRTPGPDTVTRWREAVGGSGFRFCFKLPRPVTHERAPDLGALDQFLKAMEPLSAHLGPLLVQFPATMGHEQLETFEPVFAAVSAKFRFVIEVRHPAFFSDPGALVPTLERYRAGRVVLDARSLYEGDRSHPDVVRARHEKPDLPVLPEVYNDLAFIRLVLHPDRVSNRAYLDEWARHVSAFLARGAETYVMIHCPNNLHCPPLAREFHRSLMREAGHAGLRDLPSWPIPDQSNLQWPERH